MTIHGGNCLNMFLFAAAAVGLGILTMEACRKPAEAGNHGSVCQAGGVVVVCTEPLKTENVTSSHIPLGGNQYIPLGGAAGSVAAGSATEYRLYVLDTTMQTVIVYVYSPDQNYLALAAARKVVDDLYITDYRNRGIAVEKVKELVEKTRRQ